MSEIRKGTIIGMYRERGSGMALLAIEDERRGKTLIPCDGNPTSRALDAAFPGALNGGISIDNDAIVGEPIYYRVDGLGILHEFCPVNEAPTEIVEEYEKAAKEEPTTRKAGHIGFVEPDDPRIPKDMFGGPGTHTDFGLAKPEDPVYSRGPIVAGREILKAQPSKPGTHTRGGFLPDDHWLYGAGPIVAGRAILQPPKKRSDENN